MKLFKTVDEKFYEIGFIKIKENEYGAIYERDESHHGFVQRLDLTHKASGRHLIHSYDPNLMDEKLVGNTCVGLTMYEMKLCIKKMKKMGWKMIKE